MRRVNQLFLCSAMMMVSLHLVPGCARAPKKETPKISPASPLASPALVVETREKPKKEEKIDPKIVEKALSVFEPAVRNDSKAAKLAYGRANRFLPVPVQFAIDLKLKNFVHAQSILPQAGFSEEKTKIWDKVLKLKPQRLSQAICSELKKSNDLYTSEPDSYRVTRETALWVEKFSQKLDELAQPLRKPDPRQEGFQGVLDKIQCEDIDAASIKCQPLTDDLKSEIMNDKFFDQMRNAQRRDTRFYLWNSKDPLKRAAYERSVQPGSYLKLNEAVKNTSDPKTNHFLRRLKGIAREIRSQDLWARTIGDIILDDKTDREFARRLENFKRDNALVIEVTGIDTDLASCKLSTKKAR